MIALLDTHVLLWSVGDPAKLSNAARAVIEDTSNEVLVSAVSAWEIATKHRIGKLPDARALLAGYEAHLARLGARQLPISGAHALEAGAFEWEHRDPFDRMLVAQSVLESVPLVTADRVFRGIAGVRVIW